MIPPQFSLRSQSTQGVGATARPVPAGSSAWTQPQTHDSGAVHDHHDTTTKRDSHLPPLLPRSSRPLKKRRVVRDGGDEEEGKTPSVAVGPPPSLARQVASCWMDGPFCRPQWDAKSCSTLLPLPRDSDDNDSGDWGWIVATTPPTSGPYRYEDRYGEPAKLRSLIECSPPQPDAEHLLAVGAHRSGRSSVGSGDGSAAARPTPAAAAVACAAAAAAAAEEDSELEVELLTAATAAECGGHPGHFSTATTATASAVSNSVTPSPYPTTGGGGSAPTTPTRGSHMEEVGDGKLPARTKPRIKIKLVTSATGGTAGRPAAAVPLLPEFGSAPPKGASSLGTNRTKAGREGGAVATGTAKPPPPSTMSQISGHLPAVPTNRVQAVVSPLPRATEPPISSRRGKVLPVPQAHRQMPKPPPAVPPLAGLPVFTTTTVAPNNLGFAAFSVAAMPQQQPQFAAFPVAASTQPSSSERRLSWAPGVAVPPVQPTNAMLAPLLAPHAAAHLPLVPILKKGAAAKQSHNKANTMNSKLPTIGGIQSRQPGNPLYSPLRAAAKLKPTKAKPSVKTAPAVPVPVPISARTVAAAVAHQSEGGGAAATATLPAPLAHHYRHDSHGGAPPPGSASPPAANPPFRSIH